MPELTPFGEVFFAVIAIFFGGGAALFVLCVMSGLIGAAFKRLTRGQRK